MVLEEINIKMVKEVKEKMEERHILEEEIKKVIRYAEETGKKLYRPEMDRYLAKLTISNATFYVEYYPANENDFIIHTAYSHRAKIEE